MALYHRVGGHGLLRVGGAMALAKAASIVIGVALSVVLARHLGAEGYGTYLFTLTIAQVLAMPVIAGLPTLIVRLVATYRSRDDSAGLSGIVRWSYGYVLLAWAGISLAGGLVFLAGGIGAATAGLVVTISLLILALAIVQITSAVILGFERAFWSSLADGLLRPALLLGFVATAIALARLTPNTALFLHAIAASLAAGFAVFYVRTGLPPRAFSARPRFETRLWLASLLPLAMITAAALVNSRLDVFMLGLLASKPEVAIYGIALQLVGVIGTVRILLTNLIGPRLARFWDQQDLGKLRALISATNTLIIASVLAALAFLALFGDPILSRLLGPSFAGITALALVAGLSVLVAGLFGPAPHLLSMTGHERLFMRAVFAMALCNAALNAVLIPLLGAKGAVIATVCSETVFQIHCFRSVRRLLGLNCSVFASRSAGPAA